MKIIFLILRALPALFFTANLSAQNPPAGENAYREVMMKTMQSGNYDQDQTQSWDARVKKVSGEVLVKASEGETWSVLAGEMPLDAGDRVKTAGGVAEITLDDQGVITLGRNSEFEVLALTKADSIFSLKFGGIAAKIQHFLDEKLKLQVRTPSAVCAVRGTEFAVEYSQLGKDTAVAVYDEGIVAASPLDAKGAAQGEYLLQKNTEISFAPAQKRFRSAPISRMSRYKTTVIAMRKSLPALKKNWKPLAGGRKGSIRESVFKKASMRRGKDLREAPRKKSGRAVQRVKKRPAARRGGKK